MNTFEQTRSLRAGRGFTMVSAVFLVVILAGLGAVMLNMSNVQHTSSALDVQGARAYQAARAGIEWGLYRQLRDGTCGASESFALPAGSSLAGFTVTVTCTAATYDSTTPDVAVSPSIMQYRVAAVACNGPAAGKCPGTGGTVDYVQREMQVSFQN